ncbi:MAG: LpxI family protein [Thermodesulfobacteria bacterium]|nr:LpxI family protein [Thermodesulfobacteriota bacterium]
MESGLTDKGSVGIVAGGGQFPVLCAQAASRKGYRVYGLCHKGETSKELEKYCVKTKWIHLGQLGKLISFFKKNGVTKVFFAGTIKKTRLFVDVRPDMRALALWRSMDGHLDDSILRLVAAELEKEGLEVVSPTLFLENLLFPQGILTKKQPTQEQMEDVRFGFEIAKRIGDLDIGQCIVVKDKVVLAVEAIEGTDETIRRGGRLAKGGAVVVKICKPNQDRRFDLPSVGLKTIETMIEAGADVLAAEAGVSLFFDMSESLALADRAGICVMGIKQP